MKTQIQLAAAILGKLGGQSKSPRKAEASRRNGKLGGRPRKVAVAVGLLLACLSSYGAIPDNLAARAIIGEAGSESLACQRAIASCIRHRGSLAGVYGVNNPCVAKASTATQTRARQAWLDSASVDYAPGIKFFGCAADSPYFRKIHLTPAFTIGRVTFWKQ